MSIRQMIFAFLDSQYKRTGKLDYTNEQLYFAFPKDSQNSLRTYGKQWYKSKLPKNISPISKSPVIQNEISQPTPAAVIKPTKLDVEHITDTIVEKWIISGDARAKLGMDYLQYRDKFSKVEPIAEDYKTEFKELLESEC
jgi:hypothetical protein